MTDDKLTELARTEPAADTDLRERVWNRIQAADAETTPAAPYRWSRFALAGGVMLASGVALVTLRPGSAPFLAPAIAFADVQRAMEKIQTATWHEQATWQKVPMVYYMRQNPPSIAVQDNEGSLGLMVSDARGQFSRGKDGTIWIWKRNLNIRERINQSLYFKQEDLEKSMREDFSFKWRYTPWKRTEKNGFIEFEREGTRYRDDTGWWKKQKPQVYAYFYQVDPKTNLINRSTWRQAQGVSHKNSNVRDSFRYNVPLKPGIFDIVPPVGKMVTYMDVSLVEDRIRSKSNRDLSDADVAAVQTTLTRLVKAYNSKNWAEYLALRDTTTPRLFVRSASEPEAKIHAEFDKRAEWRSWSSLSVQTSHYTTIFQATRRSESDAFPPPNPKDSVEVGVVALGTNGAGAPRKSAGFISLLKRGGVWKVSGMRFETGKFRQPATPAQAAEDGARAALGGKSAK
ncbi:MAG: hypothetical protein QM758_21490 [Armatimonas sp.]